MGRARVSASPKEFADVWGPGVGIDSAHTIGIEQLLRKGRLTGHLKGCGGLPDGSDAIMTYIDGKRCFINQTILGVKGPRALKPMPRASVRCWPAVTPPRTSPCCATRSARTSSSTATGTS